MEIRCLADMKHCERRKSINQSIKGREVKMPQTRIKGHLRKLPNSRKQIRVRGHLRKK